MFWLSGDQVGAYIAGPPSEVNWVAFDPSLSQIQISSVPDRCDTKAILRPSGEKAGECSTCVEVINRKGSTGFWPAPFKSTRQMFKSDCSVLKARRFPSRETAGS